MEAAEVGPPVIPLPRPVDRRMRLGPFASARDAVKFVCYGGVGALLSPWVSPYAWLPALGLALVVSTWRPDGEALDERAARWALWRTRRHGGGGTVTAAAPSSVRRGFLRVGSGRYVTVLRTGGTPLAYRPPIELERAFRGYGELLRASDGLLLLRAGTAPMAADPLTPAPSRHSASDTGARDGYAELVRVLCRRRLLRRVDLALASSDTGPEAPARLEQRTRALADRLAGLGLRPTRLEGRTLADAAHRIGWSAGPA